jgi:hypothetical protein
MIKEMENWLNSGFTFFTFPPSRVRKSLLTPQYCRDKMGEAAKGGNLSRRVFPPVFTGFRQSLNRRTTVRKKET